MNQNTQKVLMTVGTHLATGVVGFFVGKKATEMELAEERYKVATAINLLNNPEAVKKLAEGNKDALVEPKMPKIFKLDFGKKQKVQPVKSEAQKAADELDPTVAKAIGKLGRKLQYVYQETKKVNQEVQSDELIDILVESIQEENKRGNSNKNNKSQKAKNEQQQQQQQQQEVK